MFRDVHAAVIGEVLYVKRFKNFLCDIDLFFYQVNGPVGKSTFR